MSSSISSIAEAQVGAGNYGATGGKLDAAHFMNTTVRDEVLAQGQHLTTQQEKALAELRFASAATTMQLKSNNVGPDKVIDSCMTAFTQTCAKNGDAGQAVPSVQAAIVALADACLLALNSSPKTGNDNYQEAIAGVQAARDAAPWDVDISSECALWAKENDFV